MSDPTFSWIETRLEAVELFGDTPSAPQEAAVVEAFEQHPQAVITKIRSLTERKRQGKVRTPWHLLAQDAAALLLEPAEVKVADGRNREKVVARAEAWVANAGCRFDRAEEIEAELFEHGRLLEHFADDELLLRRMVELWREQRPRGEKVEAEHEERMRQVRESPHSKSVPGWKPPELPASAVQTVKRGGDPGTGKCDDCRKERERVRYANVEICRECAAKRDKAGGFMLAGAEWR